MYDFFDSLANSILDRSPDELIGAVIVALGLSLAFVGLDWLAGRKVRQGRTLMICLMIGANLASMAIAAGYLVHIRRTRGTSASEIAQAVAPRPYLVLVESTFRAADENRDGLISSEEAANAAAEFVRHADPTGKGFVDAASLEQATSLSLNRNPPWSPHARRTILTPGAAPRTGTRARSQAAGRRSCSTDRPTVARRCKVRRPVVNTSHSAVR